ncbi:MAG: polysaccharide deacetylase family protein, partial [Gorillibacterium sp.]|nr:polysaccharide deacetylase family protein [Gorillibacterium sp.]
SGIVPSRVNGELTLSELRRKYRYTFYLRGNPNKHEVALTFDDAPDPNFTPQILDVLKEQGVSATFFIMGERAAKYPELVRRIVREGHAIGNHTYSHPDLTRITDDSFHKQVLSTQEVLYPLIGYKPFLFRPPYGTIYDRHLKWLVEQQLVTVNWNADSKDWKSIPSKQVYANIMKNIMPGAIILQHAGGGKGEDLRGTIAALPMVIQELRKQNYSIVTLTEMLNILPPL